ncbi:MAG: thioredoxin family protein [Elusimicrobiales bacterium]|nr:thioredoxin family protein [Elusimicrobiales bacterium]
MGTKNIKTREVFEAELKAGEGRFALFYSAWCPFCTSFMPAYDGEAAAGGAEFLKVCTDDLPELEDRFSVEVVPTVLYFKDGKLARRLDGALGRGLGADGLRAFVAACAAKGRGK